jgi:predicted nucleic acid-binding protein
VLSELRGSGITVPLADAVLAAVAMSLDVEVWASDAHFNRMQRVLADLRLHQESA